MGIVFPHKAGETRHHLEGRSAGEGVFFIVFDIQVRVGNHAGDLGFEISGGDVRDLGFGGERIGFGVNFRSRFIGCFCDGFARDRRFFMGRCVGAPGKEGCKGNDKGRQASDESHGDRYWPIYNVSMEGKLPA